MNEKQKKKQRLREKRLRAKRKLMEGQFNGSQQNGHCVVGCQFKTHADHSKENSFSPPLKKAKINSGNGNSFLHGKLKSLSPKINGTDSIQRHDLSLQRKQLPVYAVRNELMKELVSNKSVIVMGETGSGKTTQIPQFLHEKCLDKDGAICITQPRRVAAISIAKRVAQEMNTDVGGIVGYSVRFEEAFSPKTKIKFVTDGMLLREAILDPLLLNYKWMILDEAHERSLNTDILFSIVKQAQKKRITLKKLPLQIIIMSATMDANHISSYFDNACTVTVEGREHPINLFHAKVKNDDYVKGCLTTVLQIHREAPPREDILVFLTGQEEIDSATKTLRFIAKDPSLKDLPTIKVFPFYSAIPFQKEQLIFQPTGQNERKVIVSTNVAETSITIPGIKYVVDSGRVKVRTYNPSNGFDVLNVQKISKAQAHQRSGRAGREGPGVCYRTFTLQEYNCMPNGTIPDILRANLSNTILQLLAIGVKNVADFDFIDKPSLESINEAVGILQRLAAITENDDICELTYIGKKMVSFPLDPRFSKIILTASIMGCLEEIITIISILSSESIYSIPTNKRDEVADIHAKFRSSEGDHVTLLRVFKAFNAAKKKPNIWCYENFLNFRNLTYAVKVRQQLLHLCQKNNLPVESCGEETEPILKCLISGLFTQVAELQYDGKYLALENRQEIFIHPSSKLFGYKPEYVLYTELIKTGKKYMHVLSKVKADWLLESDPEFFKNRLGQKTRT